MDQCNCADNDDNDSLLVPEKVEKKGFNFTYILLFIIVILLLAFITKKCETN